MSDRFLIPTGFPSLDKAINGGFRVGELIVIGGDAGSGTSSLALAIALHASAFGCVFVSGETSSDRVAERALAIESRVALGDIRMGTLSEIDEERVAGAAQRLRAQSPVVKALNHTGMAAVAQAVADHPNAKLVVVDGLEAMLTSFDARDDQLAYAVLSLKRLALAARVAVVLVTHLPLLDRDRNDRRPRLSDFGVAGAAAVHADIVFGLYRDEMYFADLTLKGAAELLILKWRDGMPGYVDLFFQADSLRFEDVLDDAAFDTGVIGKDALESVMIETGIDDTIMDARFLDDED